MAHLYMIRHGKPSSPWGQDPDTDPGLDETGLTQAKAAAAALLALPAGRRPTRVFSSPLRRCLETAEPFADAIGVSVEIDARFGEIPSPSSLAADERGPWLRNAFQSRWSEVDGDIDYDRWRAAVGEALGGLDGDSAVFSHFVAINAAVACATGQTNVLSFHPDHASITVFEGGDGQMRLVERGREAVTRVL
jgi:broad specificity phosphatase PhoE